jgi:hypothetical protein
MSTVFVIGAGASHGDKLVIRDEKEAGGKPTPPPLIRGFFKKALLTSIGYPPEDALAEFPNAFEWIRTDFPEVVDDKPLGEPEWESLNLEEVFTALELRREFESPESSAGARLLIARNQLVGYITRIIALCTFNAEGEFTRRLVSKLDVNDSVLTFNWDLLLDDAFTSISPRKFQLQNFFDTRQVLSNELKIFPENGTGLLLKLHGSLNWFLCTNPKCKFSSEIQMDDEIQYCLSLAAGFHTKSPTWTIDLGCACCGSDRLPLIIPPLLRKPITENHIIRSVWGLARRKLESAERMVLIGFSAAPTDFFAGWLLRSAVLDKPGMEVIIVNPLNDPGEGRLHKDFIERMRQLFPYKFNTDLRAFSELDKII